MKKVFLYNDCLYLEGCQPKEAITFIEANSVDEIKITKKGTLAKKNSLDIAKEKPENILLAKIGSKEQQIEALEKKIALIEAKTDDEVEQDNYIATLGSKEKQLEALNNKKKELNDDK